MKRNLYPQLVAIAIILASGAWIYQAPSASSVLPLIVSMLMSGFLSKRLISMKLFRDRNNALTNSSSYHKVLKQAGYNLVENLQEKIAEYHQICKEDYCEKEQYSQHISWIEANLRDHQAKMQSLIAEKTPRSESTEKKVAIPRDDDLRFTKLLDKFQRKFNNDCVIEIGSIPESMEDRRLYLEKISQAIDEKKTYHTELSNLYQEVIEGLSARDKQLKDCLDSATKAFSKNTPEGNKTSSPNTP